MLLRSNVQIPGSSLKACLVATSIGLAACGGGGGDASSTEGPASEQNELISTSSQNSIPTPMEGSSQLAAEAQSTKDELIAAQKSLARSLYDGIQEEHALDLQSTGHFLNTALSGFFPSEDKLSPQSVLPMDWTAMSWNEFYIAPMLSDYSSAPRLIDILDKSKEIPANSTLACKNGGSMEVIHQSVGSVSNLHSYEGAPPNIPQNDVHGHVLINYQNCNVGNHGPNSMFTYHGDVEFYFSATFGQTPDLDPKVFSDVNINREWSNYDPIYYDMVFAYTDFQITKNGVPILLNGVLEWPYQNRCGIDGALSFTVHLQSPLEGRSVLLDDMIRGWTVYDDLYCSLTRADLPTMIDGTLYLSEFGKAKISTPIWQEDDKAIKNSTNNIEIRAKESVATIKETELAPAEYRSLMGYDYLSSAVHVDISKQDGSVSSNFQVIDYVYRRGGLLNLSDSDGDGMHDSWELSTGLNPLLAGDAELDSDNDGVSNAIEYKSMGDPSSLRSVGINTDLSVTFELIDESVVTDDRITLKTYTTGQGVIPNDDENPETISFFTNVDGQWYHDPWNVCKIDSTSNELNCIHEQMDYMTVLFFPEQNGTVVISADMIQPDYDYLPDNNSSSVTINFQGKN